MRQRGAPEEFIAEAVKRAGRALAERGVAFDRELLADGAEPELAKAVAGFPDAVARTVREASPHVVADYLYGLTRAFTAFYFTAFYHACPVLDAPAPLRDGRLLLVDAARQTLRNGMLVLGMRPLERM